MLALNPKIKEFATSVSTSQTPNLGLKRKADGKIRDPAIKKRILQARKEEVSLGKESWLNGYCKENNITIKYNSRDTLLRSQKPGKLVEIIFQGFLTNFVAKTIDTNYKGARTQAINKAYNHFKLIQGFKPTESSVPSIYNIETKTKDDKKKWVSTFCYDNNIEVEYVDTETILKKTNGPGVCSQLIFNGLGMGHIAQATDRSQVRARGGAFICAYFHFKRLLAHIEIGSMPRIIQHDVEDTLFT